MGPVVKQELELKLGELMASCKADFVANSLDVKLCGFALAGLKVRLLIMFSYAMPGTCSSQYHAPAYHVIRICSPV